MEHERNQRFHSNSHLPALKPLKLLLKHIRSTTSETQAVSTYYSSLASGHSTRLLFFSSFSYVRSIATDDSYPIDIPSSPFPLPGLAVRAERLNKHTRGRNLKTLRKYANDSKSTERHDKQEHPSSKACRKSTASNSLINPSEHVQRLDSQTYLKSAINCQLPKYPKFTKSNDTTRRQKGYKHNSHLYAISTQIS